MNRAMPRPENASSCSGPNGEGGVTHRLALSPEPGTKPSPEERIWELLLRQAKRRAASPPEFDPIAYDEEHYGDPWPEHIPLGECIDVALEWAPRYAELEPAAFTAEGQRLCYVISGVGSAHLAVDTRDELGKRSVAEKAESVRALGQALALGSCVPGGIRFCSVWLETANGETAIRVLVDKASPEAQCA